MAAACGGGTDTSGTDTPATPTTVSQATPTAATPSTVLTPPPILGSLEWTRSPVEKEGTAAVPPGALMVDVRTGSPVNLITGELEEFDRITFEFEDGLPGYLIEYVEPPITEDASGLPVEIEGGAFLRITFRDAAGFDPLTGVPTYTGPFEIADGKPALLEAERTVDFEGVLTWVLGLTEAVDFRVIVLESPSFVVAIDVAHP